MRQTTAVEWHSYYSDYLLKTCLAPQREPCPAPVLIVGNFDALHVGHRKVFDMAAELAREKARPVAMLSFEPHPQKLLRPQVNFKRLLSVGDQCQIASTWGIDWWHFVKTSQQLLSYSGADFLNEIYAKLRFSGLVVGDDFAMGQGRSFQIADMAAWAADSKVCFQVCPRLSLGDQKVSTTSIKLAVERGDLSYAAHHLGRPFQRSGVVVANTGRGRQIGFATANLKVDADLVWPPGGVYLTRSYLRGRALASITNLGKAPTVSNDESASMRLETHFLDYHEACYGEDLRVEFLHYLRPETRFASVDELRSQIAQDVKMAREFHKQEFHKQIGVM